MTTAERDTDGWTIEPCGDQPEPECKDGHPFPPVGTIVATLAEVEAREVGTDNTLHTVKAGELGVVQGYVAAWHDVHVKFDEVREVWIDPDNLTNPDAAG